MKLAIIQNEIKAPKGQFNNFGKYKYRSCEDIVEAAKPVLLKYGFALTLSDAIEQIGDRYYIRSVATITDGNEKYTATAYAREEADKKGMDGSQITGAASSYARKYALNGLFAIDDTKDADSTNQHDDKQKKLPAITDIQFAKLVNRINGGATDLIDKAKETYSFTESQLQTLNNI